MTNGRETKRMTISNPVQDLHETKTWTRSRKRSFCLVAPLLLLVLALPVTAAEKSKPQPHQQMQQVFEAMSHLLPLALSEDAWQSEEKQDEITRWLTLLAKRSKALEDHGDQRDEGFRFLSRSLSANIEETRFRFELGRKEEARFFLMETTGSCVACHSRLPSSRKVEFADQLTSKIDMSALMPDERIHLLVATRQFDPALDLWETTLADPNRAPAEIDMSGSLVDYLVIVIRVQRDPDRAQKALEKFIQRDDVPRYLQRDIRSWLTALSAAKQDLLGDPSIDRARALVHAEITPRPTPLGKEQMLYDLVASSNLLRLIDQSPDNAPVLSEAYYLLGLIEARSLDSYWVPQAEYHLEMAIRLDPDAPWAGNAYAAFEEIILAGWRGASGGELPTDVSVRLRELRDIVDEAAASGGKMQQ